MTIPIPELLPPKPARKPAAKRGRPELLLQAAVVSFLAVSLPSAIVARVENAHGAKGRTKAARARFGQLRKRQGVRAGFPDLVLLLPGSRLVLVELKAAGGVLSPAQEALHPEIRARGFPVIVARSIEEVRSGLLELGLPLRASRLDGDPLA